VLPTWIKLLVSNNSSAHDAAFAAKHFQLVQVAMHHGNYVEEDTTAVCRLAKKANASTPCLFYWNTEKIYNSSVTAQYMINSKPEWLLQDDDGKFAHAKGDLFCPDYRNSAAGDFYLSACVNATRSGVVDGCVLDSAQNFNEVDTAMLVNGRFTEEEKQEYVTGKRGALQRLQQRVPDKELYVHCSECLSEDKTCTGMSGQMSQKFDVTSEWVDVMRLLASEGKGFQVYNDGKNKLSCDNDDDRGAMMGTFLIGAGNNSYFNCGPNCANAALYPEFTKPLGDPLGDAREEANGILTRQFAHGAVAKFQPGANSTLRGRACIVWADGTISGKCPTGSSAGHTA
jgi:hypothetical protein